MDARDDADEEEWCESRRREVVDYLSRQPLRFGEVGAWPAWHVAPYVSVWAVESVAEPGTVGWWVISGDLPADYASGAGVPGPRSAVAVFAKRWNELASLMARGEKHPTITVGDPANAGELAPLLKARATLLAKWVEDDSLWEDE
jgi:hypothetical protein